jgi:hypothetical protein
MTQTEATGWYLINYQSAMANFWQRNDGLE